MKKELKLAYDRLELTGLLDRLDKGPFFPVYCSEDGFWYLFRYPEPANSFKLEGEGGTWDFDKYCTDENIVMSFEGKSPREIELIFETTTYNIRYGTTGNNIKFSFATIDASQTITKEGVYATYKFSKGGSNLVYAESYEFDLSSNVTNVSYAIDNYIQDPGTYTVYVTLVGKETGTRITKSITINVREISIISDFDISKIVGDTKEIYINYGVKGVGDRFVVIKIDDNEPLYDTIPATETTLRMHQQRVLASTYGVGKHIILMYAYIVINNVRYLSETLYYEFTISPDTSPRVMIADVLEPNKLLSATDIHTVKVEQFVGYSLTWAYYTNSVLNADKTITVQWRAKKLNSEEYTSLSSLKATMYTASYDKKTDDLLIVASEVGTFELQAWRINDKGETIGNILGSWYLEVGENTTGIRETTTRLACKYSALARYNSEDDSTKTKWEYKSELPIEEMFVSKAAFNKGTYDATFENMQWSPVSGWVNQSALRLANDARCTLNCKPFAYYPTENGCTFEIEFSAESIYDADAPIITVGNILTITPTKATLSSGITNGLSVSTNYITSKDKRVKLAFIINPKNNHEYKLIINIMVNGVLDRSVVYGAESFSSLDVIKIGSNSACVYLYTVRVYPYALNIKDEFNNAVVDSEDISTMVNNNDIYEPGTTTIDVDKVKARIPCMCITGDLLDIISLQNKAQLISQLIAWTNPQEPETNFTAYNIPVRKHGQSTLNYPIPSLKFWLHKKDDATGNVTTTLKDASGNIVTTGRWGMHKNSMPLRKYVLQAFYVDSSLSKSGALMKVINNAYHNVIVNGTKVLNTPPMNFIEDTSENGYAYLVAQANNVSLDLVTFPYELRHTPDSIPCCVFYREDENSSYIYLGQFVLMDDKKSDFLYGERSIRDCLNDPYTFYHSDSDYNRIWDNSNTTRFELLDNVGEMLMFKNQDKFWNVVQGKEEPINSDDPHAKDSLTWEWEKQFELIYPDPDDLSNQEYADHANKLQMLLKWFQACYNEYQTSGTFNKFNAEVENHLDLWSFVAYYNICLDNGLFDSTIRNMQLITWDSDTTEALTRDVPHAAKWYAMWWDLDVQDGTINSGYLGYEPRIDFNTYNDKYKYAFPGSNNESFLWLALRQNTAFNNRLPKIKNALYNYGYTCDKILDTQENDYAFRYNECLYNGSQEYKYLRQYINLNNSDFLAFLQGRGEMYRRYWLTTNMDYQDAKLCAGGYTASQVYLRVNKVNDNTPAKTIFTYGNEMYVGYGTSTNATIETLILKKAGEKYEIVMTESSLSQPYQIYGCSAVKEADFSQVAPWINQIQLAGPTNEGGFFDSNKSSLIRVLNLGVSKLMMLLNYRNTEINELPAGLTSLLSLEELNLQGYSIMPKVDVHTLYNLKKLYLGGTNATTVVVPDNIELEMELPSTVNSLSFTNNTLKNIKFIDNTTLQEIEIPYTINDIRLDSMGGQETVQNLIFTWLHNIQDAVDAGLTSWSNYTGLLITDINWSNVTYSDLMLLAKIPKGVRTGLTGYIMLQLNTQLSSTDTSQITEAFGADCLNGKGALKISLSEGFLLGVSSGEDYSIEGDDIVIQAGGHILLEATKFPIIEGENVSLNWYYLDITNNGINTLLILEKVTLNTHLEFYRNGLVNTIETKTGDRRYKITVTARNSTSSGSINIVVKKRTYPQTMSIISPDSVKQIAQEDGSTIDRITIPTEYVYKVEYNPTTFNGTIDRVDWEIINQLTNLIDTNNVRISKIDNETGSVTLDYYNAPIEEVRVLLKANNINKGNIEIKTLKILSLMALLKILTPSEITGNPYLFYVLALLGKQYTTEDLTGAIYYASTDISDIEELDLTDISESLVETLNGLKSSVLTLYGDSDHQFYIPNYLTNCALLNLQGLRNLVETLDVSKMNVLRDLDISDTGITYVKFKENLNINSIHLGYPTKLELPDIKNLGSLSNVTLLNSNTKYINKYVGSQGGSQGESGFTEGTNITDFYLDIASESILENRTLQYADSFNVKLDLIDLCNTYPHTIKYVNKFPYIIHSLFETGETLALKNNGVGYIDLNYVPTAESGFSVKLKYNTFFNSECIGCGASYRSGLGICSYNSATLGLIRGTEIYNSISDIYNYHTYSIINNIGYIDGTLIAVSTTVPSTSNRSFTLFGMNLGSVTSIDYEISSFKLYESLTIIKYLVPYYNGFNYVLIDIINNKEYTLTVDNSELAYSGEIVSGNVSLLEEIDGFNTVKKYLSNPTYLKNTTNTFSILNVENLKDLDLTFSGGRVGAFKLISLLSKANKEKYSEVKDINITYRVLIPSKNILEYENVPDLQSTVTTQNYYKNENSKYVYKLDCESIPYNENLDNFESGCLFKIVDSIEDYSTLIENNEEVRIQLTNLGIDTSDKDWTSIPTDVRDKFIKNNSPLVSISLDGELNINGNNLYGYAIIKVLSKLDLNTYKYIGVKVYKREYNYACHELYSKGASDIYNLFNLGYENHILKVVNKTSDIYIHRVITSRYYIDTTIPAELGDLYETTIFYPYSETTNRGQAIVAWNNINETNYSNYFGTYETYGYESKIIVGNFKTLNALMSSTLDLYFAIYPKVTLFFNTNCISTNPGITGDPDILTLECGTITEDNYYGNYRIGFANKTYEIKIFDLNNKLKAYFIPINETGAILLDLVSGLKYNNSNLTYVEN